MTTRTDGRQVLREKFLNEGIVADLLCYRSLCKMNIQLAMILDLDLEAHLHAALVTIFDLVAKQQTRS